MRKKEIQKLACKHLTEEEKRNRTISILEYIFFIVYISFIYCTYFVLILYIHILYILYIYCTYVRYASLLLENVYSFRIDKIDICVNMPYLPHGQLVLINSPIL